MFGEVIHLLKAYGFFRGKEQEEIYGFIKKLNKLCSECKRCKEEAIKHKEDCE